MTRLDSEIHARIPTELREYLSVYAKQRDVSSSTVVRWALEDFFGATSASEEVGQDREPVASWITSFLGEPPPAPLDKISPAEEGEGGGVTTATETGAELTDLSSGESGQSVGGAGTSPGSQGEE